MKISNELLLSALKVAKEELTFIYAQDQNTKFWSESVEKNIAIINNAIKEAEGLSVFHVEDLEGSGQYVIENRDRHYKDTSYMTTLMYKVCYGVDNSALLIAMTDGMTLREFKTNDKLVENKRLLCDFLNSQNYRFASHEELVRMALHQYRRCR